MKQDIHPKYYEKAEIKCACGNVIEVGSTKESMKVNVIHSLLELNSLYLAKVE